jgi:hypothetical protein
MLKDSRTYWEKTLTWVKVSFWFSLKQYMTHKSFVKSLENIRDQTGRVSMWFLINFRPNIAYTDKLPLNPCWVLVIFSNNWAELVYTISILSFVCCHSSCYICTLLTLPLNLACTLVTWSRFSHPLIWLLFHYLAFLVRVFKIQIPFYLSPWLLACICLQVVKASIGVKRSQ